MLNRDFDKITKRFDEYWNMANTDKPLISIVAPKDNPAPYNIKTPDTIFDRWNDIEFVLKHTRHYIENNYYGGDAIPSMFPNLGPDILGACLGCDIDFGADTSWAVHNMDSLENKSVTFDPENKWYKKIVEMTKAFVDDSKGDYFVGITDLHPGMDALVSFRGSQNLCFDLYEYPDEIKKLNFEVLEAHKTIFNNLHAITSQNLPGYASWMNAWCREKWYITSCDFMCMISPDMFDEFVIPGLLAELDFYEKSIFHLDGPGALKHLDKLLEIDKIIGIQWVYGHDKHAARYWIDLLQKIQNKNKTIQISTAPEDVPLLLETLKPEGLHMITYCKSEEEAKDIEKLVNEYHVKKVF